MTADIRSTEHTARIIELFISFANRMYSGGQNNDNKSIYRIEDEMEAGKCRVGLGNPDATYILIRFNRYDKLALHFFLRLTSDLNYNLTWFEGL